MQLKFGTSGLRGLSVELEGAPTALYATADELSDFGAAQTSLSIAIYQLSATVGRGFPATQTLTV